MPRIKALRKQLRRLLPASVLFPPVCAGLPPAGR